jgi:hypothetical protein
MSKRQSLRDFEAELRGHGRHSADPPGRQSFRDFEVQLRRGRQSAAIRDGRIPRHPGDVELTWKQACDAVAALEGARVIVGVVEGSAPESLLAAADGALGPLSRAKHPALFSPLDQSERDEASREEPGLYLRRDHFEGAVARAGGSVLVISQGPVLLNIRRA